MKIQAAVLEQARRPRPYRDSRPINVCEVDLAEPGVGEVLVRIEAAGLCHSDLSVADGARPRPLPMVLGHEAAGIVDAVGPGDVQGLCPGDRVVTTFLPRCGSCEGCRAGGKRPCVVGSVANGEGSLLGGGRRLSRDGEPLHHHLGVSGFATHAVVDVRSLVKVDPDVPADVAAMMGCAVLTGGGAALNVARPQRGQTVAVVGLGGVGMAAVLVALAHPGVEVIAVDALKSKLDAARELGVHATLLPSDAIDSGPKADLVIEAAGSPLALETAIAITAPGGQTITVGLPAPDARVQFSPTTLVAEGRSIVGSYLGSAIPERDLPIFIEMWRAGRLPVERLITSRLALPEINAGLDELADGSVIRQLICP